MEEDASAGYDEEARRALKLFVVLARAAASVGEHARQDIVRHDLSVSEFGVLELLLHKGPQPQGEIADRILLTTGSVTYVIDQLVKQGLVERQTCPTDRRVIFAALTAAGRDRIAAIFPEHIHRIVRAVAGLTPTEQEATAALLKKLGKSAKAAELYPTQLAHKSGPVSTLRNCTTNAFVSEGHGAEGHIAKDFSPSSQARTED